MKKFRIESDMANIEWVETSGNANSSDFTFKTTAGLKDTNVAMAEAKKGMIVSGYRKKTILQEAIGAEKGKTVSIKRIQYTWDRDLQKWVPMSEKDVEDLCNENEVKPRLFNRMQKYSALTWMKIGAIVLLFAAAIAGLIRIWRSFK